MNKRDPDYESGQEALRRIFGDHISKPQKQVTMNETQEKIEALQAEINLIANQIQNTTQRLANNTTDLVAKEYKAGGTRGRKDTMSLRRLSKEWKAKSIELGKLYDERKRMQKQK